MFFSYLGNKFYNQTESIRKYTISTKVVQSVTILYFIKHYRTPLSEFLHLEIN